MPVDAMWEPGTWQNAAVPGKVQTMAGVSSEHTSVPRWIPGPPAVDPDGRSYVIVSTGDAAAPVAARWKQEIDRLGRPYVHHHAELTARAGMVRLGAELDDACVGVRIMLAGPELDVLDGKRVARACGAIEAEIRVHVTDAAVRRVQCPHCHAHTEATVSIGELLSCAGCSRRLVVYHHVSRAHAAYLGYMVDAEEPEL